jgi:hypothetical protein
MPQLNEHDLAILAAAVTQLERPSLAGKLAAVVGMPTEKLLGWLPDSIQVQIDRVTEESLTQALNVAMKTLADGAGNRPWKLTHKVAATMSGVAGGLFGAPALFRTPGDDGDYPAIDRRHRASQGGKPFGSGRAAGLP